MIKTVDKRNSERKGSISVSISRSQFTARESKPGSEAEAMKEHCPGLLSLMSFVLQDHLPRVAPSQVIRAVPHESPVKKVPHILPTS